ncbi:hypothetical protein CPB85DRAFT_995468 [Mucidula mucida]|nr:hypothetical protein CPB85DRAFT_995468 [Mucidula mucida]
MPDWKSTAEMVNDASIFTKLNHALLGVYAWEYFVSLGFDWEYITGKKTFRWPMVFYFLNRYLLLFALVGILTALDVTSEVNCQALYTFNQVTGNAAVGLASINLCLRTIAVYSHSRYITIALSILILGHWSLILQGVLLDAEWSPESNSCVITSTNNTILAATFIYSMVFDFIVLALNAYKLLRSNRDTGSAMGSSRLGKLLFADGLVYFIIAFLSNLLATVFMLLDLNAVMSIIFNVPAAIFNTIVACRAVRRLSNFTNQGPEVFNTSGSHSNAQYRSTAANTTRHRSSAPLGVHVQMETFTRTDDIHLVTRTDASEVFDEHKSGQYNADVELGLGEDKAEL